MLSLNDWSLRFVRWGMGLAVLGLVTGYVPLAHYLMLGAIPSCPSAPIHGHTILLSFVGMTMFGLTYRALPAWMAAKELPIGPVRAHFWLAVIGVIGSCVNGTIGYEVLGHLVQPNFYYLGAEGAATRNLWFSIDGALLTLYGIGCVIFLRTLMTQTAYESSRGYAGVATDRAINSSLG